MAKAMVWTGASGAQYTYPVYDLVTMFGSVAGNYIFARQIEDAWLALYVGETSNLADRIPDHEKWICARLNGVTHIHAHVNTNQTTRRIEELDLIRATNPPCNDFLP